MRNAIEKDESFIDTFWDNDDNIFYHVLSPHKLSNVGTERLLYDQIVQQEIIEPNKLKMLVESKGGEITDLNTDAIACNFPDDQCPFDLIDDKNINDYYWDDEKTIPKYKLEPIWKHVKYPKKEKYMRQDKFRDSRSEYYT